MNKPARFLLALAAFSAAALSASAQGSQILVADFQALIGRHWETEAQNVKIRGMQEQAKLQIDRFNQELNTLATQYKDLKDSETNPTATNEAKQKSAEEAAGKMDEIQRKRAEAQQFLGQANETIQASVGNYANLKFEELRKLASEIAKKKGAILLLDKSGVTQIGLPAVIYSDDKIDITEEVLAEVNKNKPVAPAAPAAAPATAPAVTPAAPAKK